MRVDATGPLGYALAPPKVSQKVPDSAVSIASDARLAGHPAGLRRTFAIISHPDAGKTTLTEKLLLYGGAVQLAGSVTARKNQRATTSDWMELEKQRGISISSTVLQFDYAGFAVKNARNSCVSVVMPLAKLATTLPSGSRMA